MNKKTKVSQAGDHKHISFPLFSLDNSIHFIPNFRFLKVPKGNNSLTKRIEISTSQTSRISLISLPFMLIYFILNSPIDKPLDILPGLELQFLFLLSLGLLFLQVMISPSFQVDLLHDPMDTFILFDVRVDGVAVFAPNLANKSQIESLRGLS